MVTGGQRNDGAMLAEVLADIHVPRQRRGSRGGRPPKLDDDLYKDRNVVERSFALAKQ